MDVVPMCWKCASKIVDKISLIGCKDNPEIKDYDDAQESCPLLKENQLTNQVPGV